MGHTLFPYMAWSLSKEDAEKLYAQYAYPPAKTCGIGEDTPKEIRWSIKTQTGLAWCPECAESQTTGANSLPFPIWHRLHFAPHILLCHIHQTPLSTFCDECRDRSGVERSNWIPTLECLCQNGLKKRASMGMKMHAAMLAITYKANEILEQAVPPEFTPLAIKQAVKSRFPQARDRERQVTRIFDAVVENIGEEAVELLEISEETICSFVRGEGPPSVRNPIHILAFGFASFNGFEGLVETINGSTKWLPNLHETRTPRKRTPYDLSKNKFPTRSKFKEIVEKLSLAERNELKHQGRTWLLEKLRKHPGLTRSDIWRSHKLRTDKFYYLTWIDTAWYQEKIPTVHRTDATEKISSSFGTSSEITVAMIYERRATAINENPSKKITKVFLMRPLDGEEIISMERLFPEIREALKECRDTGNSWRKRAVHAMCQMISKQFPNHRYADVSWYINGDARLCDSRLTYSKKWFISRTNQP